MKKVYVGQKPPETMTKSIFLAGPTPRSKNVASWRPEALRILEVMGYDGVVFIPEKEEGGFSASYEEQVVWEDTYLNMADCILFWIPREMETMPALTTNDEWGTWKNSGKVVLGTPETAVHVHYQQYYAVMYHAPVATTLEDTVKAALDMIGEGSVRENGERYISLIIWRTSSFQNWYFAQKLAGNRLDGAIIKYVHRVGPGKKFVFVWIGHMNVYVAAEGRNKVNEIIISRPDTSAMLMYRRGATLLDTEVVLVKEFRSPVSNPAGFVWELPGGSSFKPGNDQKVIVADECFEETGIKLDPKRIVQREARQVAATSLTHRSHLFSVELTEAEVVAIRADKGNRHGLFEDPSGELTYVEVMTIREILERQVVDWTTIGMIFSVIGK